MASRVQFAALRDLVRRLAAVQQENPEALASPVARVASYEQLAWSIYDAVRSMDGPSPRSAGHPPVDRIDVIKKATELLEDRLAESIHVIDLCRAAGVSSRTLQKVFVEHFGVGPHRYLMLRRLAAIHAALQRAMATETISQICERHGVWDFGRFAALYRRIYGVLPSVTLGRPGAHRDIPAHRALRDVPHAQSKSRLASSRSARPCSRPP